MIIACARVRKSTPTGTRCALGGTPTTAALPSPEQTRPAVVGVPESGARLSSLAPRGGGEIAVRAHALRVHGELGQAREPRI